MTYIYFEPITRLPAVARNVIKARVYKVQLAREIVIFVTHLSKTKAGAGSFKCPIQPPERPDNTTYKHACRLFADKGKQSTNITHHSSAVIMTIIAQHILLDDVRSNVSVQLHFGFTCFSINNFQTILGFY